VQLATFRELMRYWGTDYDWRKAEARLDVPLSETQSG
jgi:epoxide hydrolase-like protein